MSSSSFDAAARFLGDIFGVSNENRRRHAAIPVMRQAEEFRLGGRFKEEMPPGLRAVFEMAFAIPGLLLGVG
jgi:hypothetical protein